MPPAASISGIRDNHSRGSVRDFLRHHLKAGADLDLVTAYFTVFAYDKLRTELNHLGKIRPLFGEASFIKAIDPDHKNGAAYVLRDDGLALDATGTRNFRERLAPLAAKRLVFIFDGCHRSVYGLWRQGLEYLDAFLVGLTATPSKQTIGFFNPV